MKYLVYIIPSGQSEWRPIKSVTRNEDGGLIFETATVDHAMSYNDALSFFNDLKAQFPDQQFEMQEVEEPYYGDSPSVPAG
jgi:hypothetical protein